MWTRCKVLFPPPHLPIPPYLTVMHQMQPNFLIIQVWHTVVGTRFSRKSSSLGPKVYNYCYKINHPLLCKKPSQMRLHAEHFSCFIHLYCCINPEVNYCRNVMFYFKRPSEGLRLHLNVGKPLKQVNCLIPFSCLGRGGNSDVCFFYFPQWAVYLVFFHLFLQGDWVRSGLWQSQTEREHLRWSLLCSLDKTQGHR